jgi:hypothetical protein
VGDIESSVFEREPPGGGAAPHEQLADAGAGTANPAVAELEAAFAADGYALTGVRMPEPAILLQLFRAQGTQIAVLTKAEAIDWPHRHYMNTPGPLPVCVITSICRGITTLSCVCMSGGRRAETDRTALARPGAAGGERPGRGGRIRRGRRALGRRTPHGGADQLAPVRPPGIWHPPPLQLPCNLLKAYTPPLTSPGP